MHIFRETLILDETPESELDPCLEEDITHLRLKTYPYLPVRQDYRYSEMYYINYMKDKWLECNIDFKRYMVFKDCPFREERIIPVSRHKTEIRQLFRERSELLNHIRVSKSRAKKRFLKRYLKLVLIPDLVRIVLSYIYK